ncbi:MAG: c-type cytochrome [Burkholderiales bacterium]
MRPYLIFLALLAATPAAAEPFANADPKTGKTLHEKSCSGCHAAMLGGDAKLYHRQNRIVKTPPQLLARIAACNANTNAGLFPEEEEHIAAYLNQQYYHFK